MHANSARVQILIAIHYLTLDAKNTGLEVIYTHKSLPFPCGEIIQPLSSNALLKERPIPVPENSFFCQVSPLQQPVPDNGCCTVSWQYPLLFEHMIEQASYLCVCSPFVFHISRMTSCVALSCQIIDKVVLMSSKEGHQMLLKGLHEKSSRAHCSKGVGPLRANSF